MKKLRVGIIQPRVFYDDKKSFEENDRVNLAHAIELLRRFRKNEVDLVVFPEYYPGEATLDLSEMKELKEEARRINAHLICGESYKIEGKEHNSATVISPSGRVIGRYFKVQLWYSEARYGVQPGKKLKVFNIKGVKVGILICADFEGTELTRKLIKKGAELLVVTSNAAPAYMKMWKHDLIYQSYILKIPIVFVNCVLFRAMGEYSGGGKSKVVVPFYRKLSKRQISSIKNNVIVPEGYVVKELGRGEAADRYTIDVERYNDFRKSKPLIVMKKLKE